MSAEQQTAWDLAAFQSQEGKRREKLGLSQVGVRVGRW